MYSLEVIVARNQKAAEAKSQDQNLVDEAVNRMGLNFKHPTVNMQDIVELTEPYPLPA